MSLKIDLIFPTLPPTINGIGDHTVLLAGALAGDGHRVRILSSSPSSSQLPDTAIALVEVWSSGLRPPTRRPLSRRLVRALLSADSDVVVVQFEQFAYGRYGFNPTFALLFLLLRLRRARPIRVLIAHENYTYPTSWKTFVMYIYQRLQFVALTRSSDVVLVSTEAWLARGDFGTTRTAVIPVFSNLADPGSGEVDARMRSLRDDGITPVVWFGNVDESREAYLRAAIDVLAADASTALVYVGVDGNRVRRAAAHRPGLRLLVFEAPPPTEVSRILRGCDVALAPFDDGVTTRRGSFLACLQHGLPTLTTLSEHTDSVLRSGWDQGAFAAAFPPDPAVFTRLLATSLANRSSLPCGATARRFYQLHFSAERAARTLVAAANEVARPGRGARSDASASQES